MRIFRLTNILVYPRLSLLTSWWSSFRWFCCGQTPSGGQGTWTEIGGGLGERVACVCVGGSAGPSDCVSCIEAGLPLSREDSDGGHLCPEEVSRGFLRPSLEETLAFNRSRSVGEEKEVGIEGSCRIRFPLFSFCLPFVFFCFIHSFVSVFILLPG